MHRQRTFQRQFVELLEPRRLLTASVSGAIMEDVNANGTLESGETAPVWTTTIYADLNRNGVLDSGEPSATEAPYATSYHLSLATGGTYMIRAIIPGGYVASAPSTGYQIVTVQNGFGILGVNFGAWRIGKYSARSFDDTNSNGTQDSNENSTYNRTLWADLDGDGVMDPNEPASASDGSSAELDLRGGTYTMRLAPPLGWVNTTAPDGVTRTIQGGLGNFPDPLGQHGTYNLAGTLANDVNGNVLLDPADSVLAGWTVFADMNKNGALDTGEPSAVTDSSGNYALVDNQLANSFNLRVRNPSGQVISYFRVYGGATTFNGFGRDDLVVPASNIASGRIFADLNGNNVFNTGEYFIPNITVYADVNGNGVLDSGEPTTTTNTTGNFSFAVPNGTFAVRPLDGNNYAVNPSFPAFASRTWTNNNSNIPLGSLGMIDNAPSSRTHAHVTGVIFNDVNRNSRWDVGEALMPGQIVYIDYNNNGVRDSSEAFAVSGADGRYILADMPSTGSSTTTDIRVDTTDGWLNTRRGFDGRSVQVYANQGALVDVGIYAAPDVGVASASLDVDDQQALNVTFTYDLGASLQNGDFVLFEYLNGIWAPVATPFSMTTSTANGQSTAVLKLPQLLANGAYRLQVLPGSVADATGRKNGSASNYDFTILAADGNHNQTVDIQDFNILAANFGKTGQTWSQGNYDYSADGTITITDFNVLAANFGKHIEAPATMALSTPLGASMIGIANASPLTLGRKEATDRIVDSVLA